MNARNLVPAMLTLVREREDRVPRGRRDNGAALPASPRKGDALSVAGAQAADNNGKVPAARRHYGTLGGTGT